MDPRRFYCVPSILWLLELYYSEYVFTFDKTIALSFVSILQYHQKQSDLLHFYQ